MGGGKLSVATMAPGVAVILGHKSVIILEEDVAGFVTFSPTFRNEMISSPAGMCVARF